MSGGFYSYDQYKIGYIADAIEEVLNNMGKEKEYDEIKYYSPDFLEKYPEEKFYRTYSADTIKIMTEAVNQLRIAQIYAHRVDWFLSGDDGEESLKERLEQELKQLCEKK